MVLRKTFLLKNLQIFYPFKNIKVINTMINKDNINKIISDNFEKNEIDFMSIDVDGIDYYVFENLSYSPKIICIEFNFWYGSELKFSPIF